VHARIKGVGISSSVLLISDTRFIFGHAACPFNWFYERSYKSIAGLLEELGVFREIHINDY
jgi:hypothetical protein